MAKRRGWKWDAANSRLSIYVDGTEVARLDDVTNDLRLLVNGLTIDAGGQTITAGGQTITAGGLAVAGDSTCADKFTFSDQCIHANAIVETLTQNKTLDAQDVGKVFESALDAVVFTLPATAVGITYTIVNTGGDASAKLSISPNSDDKIMGPDIAGADNKDLINTKATAVHGDMCSLIADGSAGWYITQLHGTWAAET